ncbi:RHS repeat-associated core domain-containing protein [Luteibacter sp. UNCMF331Sha3.1]|uniref:RHS repeat-associated core domain-containing protein n=1 Tax=Luteibacter sp. UNCMF331Sha3.1 TaxID=1502760 RepID=UPI0008CC79B0|nr:RHS repeat-associated core domain-containing protein [Luteibacter sp. UNCMF331Sha3.1]SEM23875.1 RHS repeat-associated core domain-containing protein [Luteibacter sp. UNCMF331Sha3.1]
MDDDHKVRSDPRAMHLTRYLYDARTARPTAMTAGLDMIDFEADFAGRLTAQTVRMPGVPEVDVRTTVSAAGRELHQRGVDGIERTFHYDSVGRLWNVHDAHVDITLRYDGLSRVVERRAVSAHTSSTESYVYDAVGRLSVQTWEHDGPDGVHRHHAEMDFRADGKLARRRSFEASALTLHERFDYDVRGRLIDHDIVDAPAGRLPRDETGREYIRQRFAFDALDNLSTVETIFATDDTDCATYVYDTIDPDRLVRIGRGGVSTAEFRYDTAGNVRELTDENGTAELTWDGAGRLETIAHADGHRDAYRYGPGGRATAIAHDDAWTYRAFQDGRLACEWLHVADRRRYVRVNGELVAESHLEASARTVLVGADRQGSVIIDGSDAGTSRLYGAYGLGDGGSGHIATAFAGEVPASRAGWYLLDSRLYIPALRRFMNPDPFSPFDKGGLNRYAYCGGDPVGRVDPTGNAWWEIGLAVAGLVASVAAVVVSGGAALGAAGAAGGGLLSLLTTPSVVAATAVAAIDVVSLAAEAGAGIAQVTGDKRLESIFGAIGTATAVAGAAAGLAQLGKAVARRVTRFVGSAGRSATVADDARRPLSGVLPLMVYGPDAAPAHKLRGLPGARYVKPKWYSSTRNGATHWAANAEVTHEDVMRRLSKIAEQLPWGGSGDLYVYGGVHGFPKETGWWRADGTRLGGEPWIGQRYIKELPGNGGMLGFKGYRLTYVEMSNIDVNTYETQLRKPGIHLHGFCYGVAEPKILVASDMWPWPVYLNDP